MDEKHHSNTVGECSKDATRLGVLSPALQHFHEAAQGYSYWLYYRTLTQDFLKQRVWMDGDLTSILVRSVTVSW